MNTNFQKIEAIIRTSDLTPVEQAELIAVFVSADDNALSPAATLLTRDGSWVRKIYVNYRAKQAALATSNNTLWQRIVQEEEAELTALGA